MKVQHDVPLAPLTTLQLGGPAGRLLTCTTEPELVEAVRTHPAAFVLAGGSNVVLPDAGLAEVVLVRTVGIDGLQVQAGEDWDGFVRRTLDERQVLERIRRAKSLAPNTSWSFQIVVSVFPPKLSAMSLIDSFA